MLKKLDVTEFQLGRKLKYSPISAKVQKVLIVFGVTNYENVLLFYFFIWKRNARINYASKSDLRLKLTNIEPDMR